MISESHSPTDRAVVRQMEKGAMPSIEKFGTPAVFLREQLQIPDLVDGVRSLDIGGGVSNLTADLVDNGADAYALDPLYSNPDATRLEANRFVKTLLSNFDPAPQEIRDIVTSSANQFLESYHSNPGRYISAVASSLPFADETFDVVVSNGLIMGYLDRNADMLKVVVGEALRVLRPGGVLKLKPFDDRNDESYQVNLVRGLCHKELLEWLSARNIEFRTEEILGHIMLEVRK